MWNHYAASILKARIPHEMLPATRGTRLRGRSKVNFIGLVIHGLSAISVYAETVGARLMLAITVAIGLVCASLAVVIGIRLGTDLAIPGWTTAAAGLLLVIVLQMLALAVGLTLSVLFSRNNLSFLPLRDYHYFVGSRRTLYEQSK
jgi:hypothetical protein